LSRLFEGRDPLYPGLELGFDNIGRRDRGIRIDRYEMCDAYSPLGSCHLPLRCERMERHTLPHQESSLLLHQSYR
jgi:hypothetical protein